MDEFINKIGLDKIAHFGIGGLIAAFVDVVLMLQDISYVSWRVAAWGFVGVLVTTVISIFKEVVDNKFERKDVIAGVLGSLLVWLAIIIGVALNYASH